MDLQYLYICYIMSLLGYAYMVYLVCIVYRMYAYMYTYCTLVYI